MSDCAVSMCEVLGLAMLLGPSWRWKRPGKDRASRALVAGRYVEGKVSCCASRRPWQQARLIKGSNEPAWMPQGATQYSRWPASRHEHTRIRMACCKTRCLRSTTSMHPVEPVWTQGSMEARTQAGSQLGTRHLHL